MYVVNHGLGDRLVVNNTDSDLRQLPISSTAGHTSSLPTTDVPTSAITGAGKSGTCGWKLASGVDQGWGLRLSIEHDKVRCSLLCSLSLSLSPPLPPSLPPLNVYIKAVL